MGYSQRALSARASVLKGAVSTLLDPTARREYDEELRKGSSTEEVPLDYVAGVGACRTHSTGSSTRRGLLCTAHRLGGRSTRRGRLRWLPPPRAAGVLSLLQESGEPHTVTAAGEQWLSTNRRHPMAADVAVATALAHCDMATLSLQQTGDAAQVRGILPPPAANVARLARPRAREREVPPGPDHSPAPTPQHNAQSTRMLEVGLQLLREYRAGAQLQKEIDAAIKVGGWGGWTSPGSDAAAAPSRRRFLPGAHALLTGAAP